MDFRLAIRRRLAERGVFIPLTREGAVVREFSELIRAADQVSTARQVAVTTSG